MTPVLTAKLVGQYIAVDAASLFFSTVQVCLWKFVVSCGQVWVGLCYRTKFDTLPYVTWTSLVGRYQSGLRRVFPLPALFWKSGVIKVVGSEGFWILKSSAGVCTLTIRSAQVVLLPVLGGAFLNYFFKSAVKKISILAPSIAVFMVAIVCAGAVGRSASAILSSGGQLFLAVGALHGLGFAGGYILSKLFRIDEASCRTISIEVGMQVGRTSYLSRYSRPLFCLEASVIMGDLDCQKIHFLETI